MLQQLPELVERGRVRSGVLGTDLTAGRQGAFLLDGPCGMELKIIASDGRDWELEGLSLPAWEHVSVSTRSRTPNWREMEWVRDLFFQPHELILQFSVPRQKHINIHEHCLHLWRPVGIEIPLPPSLCV